MRIDDDRTAEQKKTHRILVIGTDRGMSGWGAAAAGKSYAAWACTSEDAPAVERHIRARNDMARVRVTVDPWRPKGKGHAHIYVVTDTHRYADE